MIGWGSQVYVIEDAARKFEYENPGVTVEIIDLRTIQPWDVETIEKVFNLNFIKSL